MCQSWLINPYPWFGRWGANLIENVRIFKFGTMIPYFLVDFRLSYQCLDSLCEKVLCLRKLGMKHRTCEAQAVSQILSFSRVQVTDGDLWGDSSRLEECRHVNSFFQIAWEGWLSGLSRGTFYFFFPISIEAGTQKVDSLTSPAEELLIHVFLFLGENSRL